MNKVFKKIVSAALLVAMLTVLCLGFAGCSSSEETITLRLSHTDPEEQLTGQAANKFAELVEQYTEGRVKINVYPLGQIGTSSENAEGVQMGSIDLTIMMSSMLGSLYEEFNAMDTPYIYEDRDQCVKVNSIDSPAMQYLAENFDEKCGVSLLFSFYCGTRQFTCNKPIYTPSDMVGKTFRSLTFEVNTGLIDALGATAMQIDITELAQALSTGLVDGQENPAEVIYSRQMYDYQEYLIESNHMSYCQYMCINSDKWNSIPAADQALIMKAAEDTAAYINGIAYAQEDDMMKKLVDECGMTLISEENGLQLDAFRSQVNDYFQTKYGEKYANIYSLIEQSK